MRTFALLAAVAAGVAPAAPAAAEVQAALLAQACAGCHGQNGAGAGATPPIAGLERDAFIAVWTAFRTDERPATVMNRIARGYTEDEVAALADYFAALR